jgi:hypothetical protein
MDEGSVRRHAEAHGRAVVAGDLRTAARDLHGDARSQAQGVMEAIPDDVSAAEVTSIAAEGNACLVLTRYSGATSETVVRARWAERDGRPMIVALEIE